MRSFLARILFATTFLPFGSSISAQPAPAPAAPTAAASTPVPFERAKAEEVVRTLASKLESDFVDPAAGKAYATRLTERLQAGAYSSFPDAKAFAAAVTDDLQAVHKDGYLRLHVVPPEARGGAGGPGERRREPGGSSVTRSGWLAPGVAYIDFEMFSGNEATLAEVRRFLAQSRDAEVLIIDARRHRGGGLAEMNLLFPILYDKPLTLVQMDTRRAVAERMGTPMDDDPFVRRVAGPDTVVRQEHFVVPATEVGKLRSAKVYLLTSGKTASAAEHLALSLKRTGRATLVGERTYGAGNFGGMVPLDKDFNYAAFIPVGRTFDPDTSKGWEGTGVAPHVEVAAAEALKKALELAGVKVDADAALAALEGVKTSQR
jgi:hypothetical protein